MFTLNVGINCFPVQVIEEYKLVGICVSLAGCKGERTCYDDKPHFVHYCKYNLK